MLNRLAPAAHGLGILIQPLLHGFENVLVLPSRDAAFFACGALILDCAGLAGVTVQATLAILVTGLISGVTHAFNGRVFQHNPPKAAVGMLGYS
jgi:hypothetical protein